MSHLFQIEEPANRQKMASVGKSRGENEGSGAKCRPSTWYFIITDDEVLDSTEMKEKFIDLLKSRENYRMVSLPSVDILTFSLPQAATSQTSIKGFIHGRNIRQNAIVGYFLDPASDDRRWKVEWQPIPGCYWQHDLIKGF